MKTQKETYEYTAPDKQYENYDLREIEYVTAEYIPAINPIYSGIPFIEALPRPKNINECISAYSYTVPFSASQLKSMSNYERLQQLNTLQELRFSLPFAPDIEYEMYRALCSSYSSRYQFYDTNAPLTVHAFNQEEQVYGKVIADQSSSSVCGFSLIGNSGSGKTSAIDILVSHYPQVIKHPRSSSQITQIVYLVVNCPPNSNFNQLYISIAAEIDRALGITNNYYEDRVAHVTGLAKKYSMIKRLIEAFAVGIIIFDEIQQLDFKGIRDNTFESLLTLSNETNVAIAAIGTEDAYEKMFPNERTARRVGSFIQASKYCDDRNFFNMLVSGLSRYYWFDEPMPLTEDIVDALYRYSRGIVAHLVSIYTYMNLDYIKARKKPVIDVSFIDMVIAKHFSGLDKLLADNKDKYEVRKQSDEIMAQALENLKNQLAVDKQEQFTSAAIKTGTNTDSNQLLSNIISNIQMCFSEYSTHDITNVFNKVIATENNKKKSEQELTKIIVAKLQALKKPKVTKGKKPSLADIQMNLSSAYTTSNPF